jgi:calmodulin
MILSADDIKAMMLKAGCNITGRIYYEEFVKIMFGEMLKPDSKTRSTPISDEILQELRVAFAMVDKDADGRITPRELMSVMSGLGFKSDDVLIKQMISRFDADGNGTLEFDEFHDMMRASMDGTTRWEKLKKAHTPPDTWKAFKVFDRNSDGYISKTELYQTMKELGVKLSMDDLNEMMKAADINQDGRIDYAEFSKLMTGAFEPFAKQAAHLDEQKSLYEAVFQQNLNPADLQQAFNSVDKDKDGVINVEELQHIAQSLGLDISQSKAQTIINRYGTKATGTMDLNQFMLALSRANDAQTNSRQRRGATPADSEDMHTAFRVFDVNSDGFIDSTELQATMHDLTGDALTDADVDAMIRSADRDGDGRINYEEFVEMMRSK